MFGVKHWYEHEMEAVGHLASMEDAYLRRMYASKVVNGMNHLTKAIDEKVADPGYEQKKRDLELMKASVMRTMEHLKKDYDVSEGNISYKWNTGTNNVTMPSSFEPKMNTIPSFEPNMSAPPSFNENTLSLNEDEPMSLNESILTLNNMKNFATAKTNTSTLNLTATTLNNANNMPTLNNPTNNVASLNVPSLNAPSLNAPSLNAPRLNNVSSLNNVTNLNNANNKNKNKNKNKNTLVGGRRRKHKKARHTRRR